MIYLDLFPDHRGNQGSPASACNDLHQPVRIFLVIVLLTVVVLAWLLWQVDPPEELASSKEVRIVPFAGPGTDCGEVAPVLAKIGPTLDGKPVRVEPCRDRDPGAGVGSVLLPDEIAVVMDRTTTYPGYSTEIDYGHRRVFVIHINPDLQNRWTAIHEWFHIIHGHTAIPRPQNMLLAMIANTMLDLLIMPDLVRATLGLAS